MEEKIDKQIHADEIKLRLLMTDGCNLNCAFCLNDFQPKPEGNPLFLDSIIAGSAIEEYASFFEERYPLQVYFSGGEPTLHPDLVGLMDHARSFGCRVTLNTNGKFPDFLESDLVMVADNIHFGTYKKDENHAERVKRMGGLVQGIYPYADEDFVEFYSSYGLPIKIFRDFYDRNNGYETFAQKVSERFPDADLSFRHTGIQENRGPGCDGCDKRCVTLKAAWVFPDGGSSPCPQLHMHPKVYLRSHEEWSEYFRDVERYHKRENGF